MLSLQAKKCNEESKTISQESNRASKTMHMFSCLFLSHMRLYVRNQIGPLKQCICFLVCFTLTTPDGYTLTTEGQRVFLVCIGVSGLAMLINHPDIAGYKKSLEDQGYKTWYPGYLKTIFSKRGIPYFTGNDLFMVMPKSDRNLSNRIRDIEERKVRKDMVLMQGSGQRYGLLGNPILVTEELHGVVVSHIMMRIEHQDPVQNAYLCAFLSTDFGKRLTMQYATGTMVPYINDRSFSKMKIPILGKSAQEVIGAMVLEAYSLRTEANKMEQSAQRLLRDLII